MLFLLAQGYIWMTGPTRLPLCALNVMWPVDAVIALGGLCHLRHGAHQVGGIQAASGGSNR